MRFLLAAFILTIGISAAPTQASNVYICVSPGSKKYHGNRNCSGLNRCTHRIDRVSLQDAKDRGLENCLLKNCY